MDSIAIIGANHDEAVVWSVYVGSRQTNPFSRLTGAWILPFSGLENLHIWPSVCSIVCLGDESEGVFKQLPINAPLTSTLQLREDLAGEVNRLQSLYEQEVALSPKKKVIQPIWPDISFVDFDRINEESIDTAARVLRVARWASDMADNWDQIEEIRLARSYMRKDSGGSRRTIPWVRNVCSDTLPTKRT